MQMRALEKLKDKNGKVSEEKRKEKINKLVEHDVRLVGGKTHLKIGGKHKGLSFGGEKFEERKVVGKKPSAITSMLSGKLIFKLVIICVLLFHTFIFKC